MKLTTNTTSKAMNWIVSKARGNDDMLVFEGNVPTKMAHELMAWAEHADRIINGNRLGRLIAFENGIEYTVSAGNRAGVKTHVRIEIVESEGLTEESKQRIREGRAVAPKGMAV